MFAFLWADSKANEARPPDLGGVLAPDADDVRAPPAPARAAVAVAAHPARQLGYLQAQTTRWKQKASDLAFNVFTSFGSHVVATCFGN